MKKPMLEKNAKTERDVMMNEGVESDLQNVFGSKSKYGN
jgi:hypothetical protein